MTFKLRDVPISFLGSAPKRWTFDAPIAAEPSRVFDAISADPSTWTWFPGMTGGRYTGDSPPGVGSIREARQGPSVYRETVMAWDAPSRYVYRLDETTVPLARALVEEWTIEEASEGSVVRWTFAIDPRLLFVAMLPVAPRAMGRVFRRAMRNLNIELCGTESP